MTDRDRIRQKARLQSLSQDLDSGLVRYQPAPHPKTGGCLTFGFLMKWLAALGLGAGTVTLVSVATISIAALAALLVSLCLLCGFMGTALQILSELSTR